MKIRFRTESGSLYELDKEAMTWTRLEFNGQISPFVRSQSGDLSTWPEVLLGCSVIMTGTAYNSTARDLGGMRIIETTPVIEIMAL